MKNTYGRAGFGAVVVWVALFGTIQAQGESTTFKTGKELVKAPGTYIGQSVSVRSGYCFYDEPDFVCIGKSTPFEAVGPSIPAGPIREAIKANCGGKDGAERNPSPDCAYAFKFQPTAFKPIIGDYFIGNDLQSEKRLIHFQAQDWSR